MQIVSARRHINIASKDLWPHLADVRDIKHWHYNIKTVDLLSSAPSGKGAARRCNFHDGSSVREDVISVEENRKIKVKLSEFSVPMKHLELEIELQDISANETLAILTLRYVMKYGLVGKLLGATAVRKQLNGVASKLLAGLDHYAKTNQDVGKDFFAKAS